jgi:protein-disulfide isomerase
MLFKNKIISPFTHLFLLIVLIFPNYAKGLNDKDLMQDKQFDEKVKECIINNPEIIIESLEKYQKNKEEIISRKINSYIKDNLKEIESTKLSPYAGNLNGDVTIIMFFDYSCGYCKKENEIINQLLIADPNIKIIYKPSPMLGESSAYLSKMALAVYLEYPGKFKEFHDECMSLKQVSEDNIKQIFKKYNIDYSKIELAFFSKELKEIQNEILLLGKNIYLSAVPTCIINGNLYQGMLNLSNLANIIEKDRNKDIAKN